VKTSRMLTMVAIAATTALGIAACGSSSGTANGGGQKKVDHVTIGVIEDFSGPQGPLGTADVNGIKLAADEINAAGGIKSLGGAKLVIKKYDTETNPDKAVAQATKAVADGVNFVIGGEISDTVIAGSNVTHRAGIPWMTPGGTAAQITKRGYKDMFQMVINTDQAAENYYNVMKYVADKLGLAGPLTTGMSVSDTTYGNNLDAGFSEVNKSGTFNVITKVSYPLTTTDLSSVAARMISKKPQVLYNEGYPTDGLNFGKLFSGKFTTTAKILLSTGDFKVITDELGAKANGMLLGSGPSSLFKGMPEKFAAENAKYKAANGSDMPSSAVSGYIMANLVHQALEKAGSAKGSAIAAALHQIQLTHDQGNLYPQDTVSFTPIGTLTAAPAFFVQIQDGKAVGIFPENVASAQPIAFR
jgi:branched-chain amino acid transport system substrate-binding protein